MRVLWMDTETTGLDKDADEIITLSGFITDGLYGDVLASFDYKMRPTVEIGAGATAVNGYDAENTAGFADRKDTLESFKRLLREYLPPKPSKGFHREKAEKYVLAGYNVEFDAGMVTSWFEEFSRGEFKNKFVNYTGYIKWDVLNMVYREAVLGRINLPKHNLGAVCEHFKIPLEAHNSMNDIIATQQLSKLLG